LGYAVRRGSGGAGRWRGGDGICRQILALADAQVTLLTERRQTAPYGLSGGQPGQTGRNMLIRRGEEVLLPGKGTFEIRSGDILSICTPGGGGFGSMIEVD
jgi:N-methylhydantoinase B